MRTTRLWTRSPLRVALGFVARGRLVHIALRLARTAL